MYRSSANEIGARVLLTDFISVTSFCSLALSFSHSPFHSLFKTHCYTQHALDDMRAQLIGRHSYNAGVDLKMRYCEMESIAVINDVLRKYHLLMSAAAYKKLSKKERR